MTRRAAWGCLAVLSLAGALRASAEGGWARWPLPLAETEWVLTGWLSGAGFEITKTSDEAGLVRLSGLRGSDRREVLLRPCSALATCVRPGGAPDAAREKELSDLLGRYLAGVAHDRPLPDDQVPPSVLALRAAAVCLEVQGGAAGLHSSGFAVDGDSRILTTAHDLDGVREVKVTWEDGRQARGRLLRTDPGVDLALFELTSPPPVRVSLRGARGLLENGEELFSIGCPSGAGETIRSGRVRTPMKKVGTLRLWEVEMETLPGGSGSPVFDALGNLAGVVKGRFRGTETTGFVIPVEAVVRFLDGG